MSSLVCHQVTDAPTTSVFGGSKMNRALVSKHKKKQIFSDFDFYQIKYKTVKFL